MSARGYRESSRVEKLETDIAIMGGGGSGLTAAVAAAEKGAKVIVLEKRKTPGGNSAMAMGLFGVESPVQERMRIEARRDEFFKIAMDYSHWKINPRIVRAFVDKSGDTIRWLEEKGVCFDRVARFYPTQFHPVYHCPKVTKGREGAEVVRVLVKNSKDLGVRFLLQTSAKRILINEKGNVTGVLATTKEKELRINARSVIIATGGYGGNKELLKKYYPSYTEDLHYMGIPPLMGDGLLMAIEVGAATEGLGTLLLHGPALPGAHRLFRLWGVSLEPYTVWVNKRGERFVDESWPFAPFDTGNAQDRQPEKVSYCLLDEKIKRSIMKEGVKKGLGSNFMPGAKVPELEKLIQLQADKEWAKVSRSWGDIARWIGVAPRVLESTIEEYNHFCDQGYDEIFAKDRSSLMPLRTPPYYALKFVQGFLDTIGGIKINHYTEVLNHRDNPIAGLYAAGVSTGGWVSDTYCLRLTGHAFGFALNSGRIAGENAAKYVSR